MRNRQHDFTTDCIRAIFHPERVLSLYIYIFIYILHMDQIDNRIWKYFAWLQSAAVALLFLLYNLSNKFRCQIYVDDTFNCTHVCVELLKKKYLDCKQSHKRRFANNNGIIASYYLSTLLIKRTTYVCRCICARNKIIPHIGIRNLQAEENDMK